MRHWGEGRECSQASAIRMNPLAYRCEVIAEASIEGKELLKGGATDHEKTVVVAVGAVHEAAIASLADRPLI